MSDTATAVAADIGGTHARFARATLQAGRVVLHDAVDYPVAGSASLGALVRRYLDEHPGPVRLAALGVAAPVVDGRADPVNLPWPVAEAEVRDAIGHDGAVLLNDLLANAWGVDEVPADQLVELQPDGLGTDGNRVVCSAGTGFGVAGMVRIAPGHWQPFAGEGGHVDYAPVDDETGALLTWVRARHPAWGHVSAERIISGPGIPLIWAFLVETGRAEATPVLQEAIRIGDPAAAIAERALAGDDPSAVRTMEILVEGYGSMVANYALVLLATGGIYIGGGIAPRILPLLRDGRFLAAFHRKGRYRPLLERMPVRVIVDDRCALRGAARVALSRTHQED